MKKEKCYTTYYYHLPLYRGVQPHIHTIQQLCGSSWRGCLNGAWASTSCSSWRDCPNGTWPSNSYVETVCLLLERLPEWYLALNLIFSNCVAAPREVAWMGPGPQPHMQQLCGSSWRGYLNVAWPSTSYAATVWQLLERLRERDLAFNLICSNCVAAPGEVAWKVPGPQPHIQQLFGSS